MILDLFLKLFKIIYILDLMFITSLLHGLMIRLMVLLMCTFVIINKEEKSLLVVQKLHSFSVFIELWIVDVCENA